MILPRRVRRRLLLPPGWVALGFLLLLGCWQFMQWEQQFRPTRVLQLTIPTATPKLADLKYFSAGYRSLYYIPYKTTEQLNTWRPWHDVTIKGNDLADFFAVATVESATRQIIADADHEGGVRIQFLPDATYASLIKVLDIMRYVNQKRYWLDVRHQSVVLYAITLGREQERASSNPSHLGCCTCYPDSVASEAKVANTNWYLKLQDLVSKPWMPISMLNAWLLFRLRRAHL